MSEQFKEFETLLELIEESADVLDPKEIFLAGCAMKAS